MRRFCFSHNYIHSLAGAAVLRANVARCTSGSVNPPPETQKLARIFGMELNRIKSEYARTSTPQQQKQALKEISRTPLSSIQGLDGKLVAQVLSTLVSVEAPPGLAMTEQCAAWLCTNIDSPSLSGNALAQALHALKLLQCDTMPTVIDTVSPKITAALESMTPSSIVMLLDALCETRTVESHGAQILVKVQEVVAEGTVTDTIMLSGALARLPESEDTTFLLRLAVQKFLNASKDASPVKSTGEVAALIPVLEKLEPSAAAALQQLLVAAFQELGNGVPLRDAVALLRSVTHIHPSNPVRELVVRGASALDLSSIPDEKAVQIIFAFSRVAPLTPEFAKVAASIASRSVLALSHPLNHKLLLAMEGEPSCEAEQQKLLNRLLERMMKKNHVQSAVDGQEVASVLLKGSVESCFQDLRMLVQNNASRWKPHDALVFLEACSAIQSSKFSRKLMRDAGPLFVSIVSTANSTQLSSISACYGRAHVRNDALCDAIANRSVLISGELSLQSLCIILTSLAVVNYRANKAFVELATVVRQLLPRATAQQVANLTGAFSKMMVWNYRLFASLSQRAFEMCEDFNVPQTVTVVSGLNRMGIRHEEMFQQLLGRIRGKAKSLTLVECVHLLSAFSHGGTWDVIIFDELAARLAADPQPLTAPMIGEVLMAYARVGLQGHKIFQELSLRALAVAPTCPPIALANIATAYSAAGCRHEELFSVLAERVLQTKDECPAVTIGAILAAFANIGLKNDRLFIEMIPRVRHVAQYGTPKDVSNVVTAYATVGLWHYKLFVKLADRAIQLRGECRGVHIAQILSAYAKVEMKYDKLFSEFSLRIQTIAHVLSVSEIVGILQAFAKIGIFDSPVFFAVGDRLATLAAGLEEREAEIVVAAYSKANVPHQQLMHAISEKFPKLQVPQSSELTTGPGSVLEAAGTLAGEVANSAQENAKAVAASSAGNDDASNRN